MPISPYLRELRRQIGSQLIVAPSVVAVIRHGDGRILVARHSSPAVWALPGGLVEPHEVPADALVREVEEETGLVVEPVRLIGVYGGPQCDMTYTNGDRVSYVMTVLECQVTGGGLRPDGEETLEFRYVDADEAAGLALPPWTAVVFPDVFAGVAGGFQRPTPA